MEIIVAVFALLISAMFSLISVWKNSKKDDVDEAEGKTVVIVKLENIYLVVSEIKDDIKLLRNEMREHETRLIRLEEQGKQNLRIM